MPQLTRAGMLNQIGLVPVPFPWKKWPNMMFAVSMVWGCVRLPHWVSPYIDYGRVPHSKRRGFPMVLSVESCDDPTGECFDMSLF